MIEIYQNTKIYIVAPANVATGGPELLHQLGFHLINNLHLKTFIYYQNFNSIKFKTPIHPAYEPYNVPYILEIFKSEDIKDNILVVPEVLSGLRLLPKYKQIRKIIWWLSVDNFYLSCALQSKWNFFIQRALNKVYKMITGKILIDINDIALRKYKPKIDPMKFIGNAEYHLAQSFYALNFLKRLGIEKNKIFYLSDYLNKTFLETRTDLSKKENIVAYNPKKGFAFTPKIISSAKDIKFVPLVNMTRAEVIQTLQKAKVYIDFGNHPGKDRMPREAAILGCCVITGKRGSAAFFEDVSIPEQYKFEDKEKNIPKITKKIKDCFENFEERYKDFDYYRKVVKNGPRKFVDDLKKIFVRFQK